MSPRYRYGLVAAFAVQVALLGWMIWDRAMLIQNGREIRLAVVPVDPRDLFLGDYVVLSYGISRIDSGQVAGDNEFFLGDAVYVTIADEGAGNWRATALAHKQPDDGVFLKGTIERVASIDSGPDGDCTGTVGGCFGYDINYNLERFYVPEGTGREIENMRNDQRVSVDVAVASDGRAALKRLLVDGEVRYDEPLI